MSGWRLYEIDGILCEKTRDFRDDLSFQTGEHFITLIRAAFFISQNILF